MYKKQDFIVSDRMSLLKSISLFKGDLSNKSIKNFIRNEMVMVNDKIITNSSFIVNKGDKVEISYTKKIVLDEKIDVIYEDEYLVAINKPSGLLSISNDKEKNITAYRMVSDYVKRSSNNKYIFVVHRLDQDTSGILLFCKNKNIRDKMQNNWNNFVKKRGYIAIMDGKMTGSGTIKSNLLIDKKQFVYSSKNGYGLEAITHYEVLRNNQKYSLVQVFIDTGRRNQIRVHFSERGYPIVGDKKYKCKSNPIKRLCLHANILEFIHPVSKKIIHLECEMPDEFNKLI